MSKSASQTPNLPRKNISKSNQGPAGAVDEDFFYEYFNSVETREVSSIKELQDIVSDIIRALKGHNEDWEKRMKALRSLQSITSSAASNEEFLTCLRQLQVPLQSCLADLRSQVVREACLCVAYLAHILKIKFEQTADTMMPYLIGLISNSARVMATSGMVSLTIIISNIHSPKILLQVISAMNSKSNSTRRFSNRLLETICSSWDSSVLEKQMSNVEAALHKGMADADQEARCTCRSTFLGFALNFPQEANKMMMVMDAGRRSLLEKELLTHPANDIMSQVVNANKRRTSCPPTTLKLGTRGIRTPSSLKKSSVPDSGDESSQGQTKSSYSSLNRPRAKVQPDRSTNLMTTSVNRGLEPSRLQDSNSNLSSRSYRTSTRTTPKLAPRNDSSNNVSDQSSQRYEPSSGYRYKPSGSASASLPRRKNITTSSKGVCYPPADNGMGSQNNGYSGRKRFDSSDDNGSETSSLESSDISKSSLKAYKPTENVQEIIRQLSSPNWADKKDGLINFQNLLQSTQLNLGDLKKFVDVLNTIFSDTKSKIFPLFLGCIQQLIESHKQFLSEWLYTLLLNLITKQANETMASRQKPIQETLSTIRSQFPLDIIIRDCCKILGESYSNTSMKLKMSILAFFKTVLIVSPSNVLEHSLSSLTPTVSILIDWAFDSKWQEVRKISNALLLKFNDLHPQVLDTISQCLPPIARQKINNLVKHASDVDPSNRLKMRETYLSSNRPKQTSNSNTASSMTQEDIDNYIRRNTEDLQALSVGYNRYDGAEIDGSYNRLKVGNMKSQMSDSAYPNSSNINAKFNQNMLSNSGASYMLSRFQSSLRNADYPASAVTRTSDVIDHNQGFYLSSQRKLSTESLGYSCYPTYDSGAYNYYPPMGSGSTISDHMGAGIMSSANDYDVNMQSQSPMGFQMLKKISELPSNEMILTILAELCNINQRTEQRKACLMKLINIVRENSLDNWGDIFKTTLMRLLETLKDNDPEIRCLALRVLQELTKNISTLFDDFTHLTVLKVLQTHKDPDKTVVRAAEECSQILARCLSQSLCIRVLAEVIKENDCRLNLGGLKMLLEVLKALPESLLLSSMEEMMPGLVRTSEHDESHIRKASIFCLVEIHRRIGDNLWPYLANLSSSKVRLLRLYIDKNKSSSRMTDSSSNF